MKVFFLIAASVGVLLTLLMLPYSFVAFPAFAPDYLLHLPQQLSVGAGGRGIIDWRLSDWIGGVWMKLCPGDGLVWHYQLGGVLWYALGCGIVGWLLFRFRQAPVRWAIALAALAGIIPYWSYLIGINYYTVPLLLGLVYLGVLWKYLEDFRNPVVTGLVLGGLNAGLFFAKSTSLAICALPVGVFVVNCCYQRKFKINFLLCGCWLLGFFLTAGSFYAWYKFNGFYDVPGIFSGDLALRVVKAFHREYFCKLAFMAGGGLLAYGLSISFMGLSKDPVMRYMLMFLPVLAGHTFLMTGLSWSNPEAKMLDLILFVYGGAIFYLIFLGCSARLNFRLAGNGKIQLWSLVFFALLTPLGSNVGYWSLYCTAPLIAAVLFWLLIRIWRADRRHVWVFGVIAMHVYLGAAGGVIFNLGDPAAWRALRGSSLDVFRYCVGPDERLRPIERKVETLKAHIKPGDRVLGGNGIVLLALRALPAWDVPAYLVSGNFANRHWSRHDDPDKIILPAGPKREEIIALWQVPLHSYRRLESGQTVLILEKGGKLGNP